jgi:hypothetical protein
MSYKSTQIKRLPKSLTTVTPFSKALAMILFILLPFVGFYLGMNYQAAISPEVSSFSQQSIQITPTPTAVPVVTTVKCGNEICNSNQKCESTVCPLYIIKGQPNSNCKSTYKCINLISSTPSSTPNCIKRPACLDAKPRCLIAEPANGWCPTSSTP